MKKKFGYFVLEIIPVMIGVFLGFMVSNWAESRKKTSQKKVLTTNIISEITENKKKIENVIEYHAMLRDSSRYYSNNFQSGQSINFFSGVSTASLTSSAFETGIQTGLINEFSLDELREINELYTRQHSYENLTNILFTGVINVMINWDNDDVGNQKLLEFLSMSMTDFVIQENLLLEKSEIVLAKIGDK